MSAETVAPDLVVPDYGGACLTNVARSLIDFVDDGAALPSWMPPELARASQVVLLLLDGVGWEQLRARGALAPTLTSMTGGPITTVVPSTTASALTSLTTGRPPGDHGLVGYRMHVGDGAILNVLRWITAGGDARQTHPPRTIQKVAPFGGRPVPVVSRTEFGHTGFTEAHLGSHLVGWRMPSTMRVEIRRLLDEGERFVYAYYDGVDKIAHEHGLDDHFDAELAATDRLVADVMAALPTGAALVVVSDHGQVDVRGSTEVIDTSVVAAARLVTGEARFRWFHAHAGNAGRLAGVVRDRYGAVALVRTVEEIADAGWLGGITPEVRDRLGDVALIATGSTAYLDPTDPSEPALSSRHGALTSAEMLVPLLAFVA